MRRLSIVSVLLFLLSAAVAWGTAGIRARSTSSTHRPHVHAKRHGHRKHAVHRKHKVYATTTVFLGGDQAVESTVTRNAAGVATAFPFSAQTTGSATSVTVYVDSHNRANKLIAGVYADGGGQPGALLTSGASSSPKGGGWNTVTVSSVGLTSGVTYWIALLGKSGTAAFRGRTGGPCSSITSAQSSLTSLPSVWTSGAKSNTCPLSAYVSGTPTTVTAPVNMAPPVVSGSAMQGDMVSTSNGSWSNTPSGYAYGWEDCDSYGNNCAPIGGATSSSYTLTSADVGHTIRSVVTASNTVGSTAASSASTPAVTVPPSPPSNTALPQVTGSAVQSATLTSSTGSWSNTPTGYAYAWEDCDSSGNNCVAISGATSSSYTLASGDVGNTVRVVVTASNAAGSASASSAPTAVVAPLPPTSTAAPVISGQTVQGQTLTTSNGSWTGSPTGYSYQWQHCTSSSSCSNISGATGSGYTLQSSDVGDTIDAVVNASNAGGSTPATSSQTATVTAGTGASELLGDQTIESSQDGGTGTSEAFGYTASASGTATSVSVYLASTDGVSVGLYADSSGQPGARLDSGTVSGNNAGWVTVPLSGGVSISQGAQYWLALAATSSTASVTYRDSGGSGSNLDYSGNGLADPYSINGHWSSTPASVYLSGTTAPLTAPSNTSAPTISGTAQKGQTLTATTGSWSGNPSPSYTYQWQDCTSSDCSNISGATGSSYTLKASDVGDTIDVVVTATNSVGSGSATSAKTGAVTVPAPPSNTAVPVISGTAQQGQTLTTSNGSWTNSPTSYAYQWQDCTTTGCTNIAGATSSSYTLQSSDVGDTIDAIVTATNAGGSSSATSGQTGTVTSASVFSPLHVSGTELLNASGQPVFLHGVDRSGTEYSCIHNTGFFDGTGTSFSQEDAQITSMAAWHANAELIPLNEDCWLGINGAPSAYSNPSASPPTPGCSATQCPYANAIENLVKTDEANHIYPVISGFWLAPGTTQASSHIALADNDHTPLLWQEVANFFKNDSYVIFRLEQEPTLWYGSESDWQCWSQGDVSYGTGSDNTPPTAPTPTGTPNTCANNGLGIGYATVGMQSLVNIVRGTGATNVVALPGLGYSNMVACGPSTAPSTCGMLNSTTPAVTDPISPANLVASVDVYPEGNTCGQQLNTSCYDATYKPVAQAMPLIAGEIGESPSGTTTTTYVNMFMNWMDTNGNGYFAWAWDPWAQLISSYTNNSTPNTTWGTDYHDHINNTTPAR
jgi:hypothetical protein